MQDEKISYFRIRCRYNRIPLRSTPSLILGINWDFAMTNDNSNASTSFVTGKSGFEESSSGFEQEILAYAPALWSVLVDIVQ